MVKRTKTIRDRHAETETGAVRKSWKGRIHVVLIYPNTYYVGMSNLGFQTVYKLLNEREDVLCERAFLPEDLRSTAPILTVESGKSLLEFDIIAFSLSFENDYPNVLTILEKAGIPTESANRGDPLPLVVAGGIACFLNPEPLAAFIDCFFIGEAELLLPGVFNHFNPDIPKIDILKHLAIQVPGVYVPSLYRPTYTPDGLLAKFTPISDVPEKVQRVYAADLAHVETCTAVLTPHTVFDRTFLIEVARGCPHGCRFCSAGFVYRPYRTRPYGMLERCLRKGRVNTDRIGLVGMVLSDVPDVMSLCEQVAREKVYLSFSSLRADGLSPEILAALKQSGVKTVAMAPDAGSQRLRDVINKGIDEDDILNGTELLVASDVSNVKLYFMIGLPTENAGDIDAIVNLCKKVKAQFLDSSRKKGRMGKITVSLNPFIPKPFTPFQWVPMDNMTAIKQKIERVRRGLKSTANIHIQAGSPRQAFIQGLYSRGDRRVARILSFAHQHRANWTKTLKKFSGEADFFARRERYLDENLPWDFIDHGIKKEFLVVEYERAMMAKKFPRCDIGTCTICGVCEKRT